MGEVVNLNKVDYEPVDTFVEELKAGNITHGVIAYRNREGDLEHILINPDHSTYLIGLLERVKMELMVGE